VIGTYVIAAVLLYFVLASVVATVARRYLARGSPEDFYIASGRVGGFVSAMTYAATTYSAFMMIGLVGYAYATGVGALGFELIYLVSTLFLLSSIGLTLWRLSRELGFTTPSEMFVKFFGWDRLGIVVTVIAAVSLIPYSSIQLIGVGLLLHAITGGVVPYWFGLVVALVFPLFWGVVAGFRSIAWTDAVQGMVMLGGSLALLSWVLLWGFGSWSVFVSKVNVLGDLLHVPNRFWSVEVFVAFTLPWAFFAISNPQVVQRLYVPRDRASFTRMVLYFALFGLIYTVIVTLLGLMVRVLAEFGVVEYVDPRRRDLVTPTLLRYVPVPIAVVVSVSIVAAATSTLNSILLTLSSMVARDLKYMTGGRLRPEVEVRVCQLFIVLFSLITLVFAALRPGYIVDLAVLSSTLLLPLAVMTLLALVDTRSRYLGKLATIPLIASVSTTLVLAYVRKVFAHYIPALTLPTTALLTSLVLYLVVRALAR